jgi:dihydrodipicolinate synthase/N-acetylneuraminate lyase
MSVVSGSLSGIFAPVTTPFRDGDLDLDGWRSNLAMYAASRLAGIVVLGSNGEAPLLDDGEADRLVESARESIAAPQWLIAGTGRESTRATVAASRRAAALGVDAVMVRTPSFYKGRMTADAFIAHYEAVADACPVPVILYNVTVFTGVNLTPAAAIRLSAHPNIAGIKDSGGDVAVIADLAAGCPRGFGVLAGSAAALYASLVSGATGAVIGPAAVVPDLCVRVFEAVSTGRHDDARAAQSRLMPIARLVGARYSVPGLKAAVEAAGLVGGVPRPPLLPVPPEGLAEIREAVEALMQPA